MQSAESEQIKNETPPTKTAAELMQVVQPIKALDNIENVFDQLSQKEKNAAPVVNEVGYCIGILTFTDIQKYKEIKKKYEEGDRGALDDVFEVNRFGIRRVCSDSFHHVRRHMTTPVITARENTTAEQAQRLFDDNPGIHHLVIVDEKTRPLGIVEPKNLMQNQ